LVRLFGQSPSGFNSGDSEVRQYYDGILQRQEKDLRVPLTQTYQMVAQSIGVDLKEGFKIDFRPLWQMNVGEKADIAAKIVAAVGDAHERGLISDEVAVKELRQSGHDTGIFTNITDDDIEVAKLAPPPVAERVEVAEVKEGDLTPEPGDDQLTASEQQNSSSKSQNSVQNNAVSH
jgi:hypothetical protein